MQKLYKNGYFVKFTQNDGFSAGTHRLHNYGVQTIDTMYINYIL